MENTHITALVPKGEHFDASAMNEGIFITEAHFNAIEESLAGNASIVAGLHTAVANAEAATNTATAALTTANETIAQRDATIAAQAAEIATLKAGPAAPISTTSKEEDKLDDKTNVVEESETTKKARELRAMRDGAKQK